MVGDAAVGVVLSGSLARTDPWMFGDVEVAQFTASPTALGDEGLSNPALCS